MTEPRITPFIDEEDDKIFLDIKSFSGCSKEMRHLAIKVIASHLFVERSDIDLEKVDTLIDEVKKSIKKRR